MNKPVNNDKIMPDVNFIFATSTKLDGNMSASFGLRKAVENRSRFVRSIGLNPDNLILLKQLHGNRVFRANDSHIGLAKNNTEAASADAMITDDPKLSLAIFTADCLPIFLCDETTGSFGIAHAGRKGTVKNIAGKTVEMLENSFSAKAQNIRVAFGAGIHHCHYDQQLLQDKKKIEEFSRLFPEAVERKNDKYYFDLLAANSLQLIKVGIKKENIDRSQSICTACNPNLYWSYHQPQKLEGVIMSVIGISKYYTSTLTVDNWK